MTAKIIQFSGVTTHDIDPDLMLENFKGKFEGVLLMGWDHEGKFVAASSYADGGTVLWLMELCKQQLMSTQERE